MSELISRTTVTPYLLSSTADHNDYDNNNGNNNLFSNNTNNNAALFVASTPPPPPASEYATDNFQPRLYNNNNNNNNTVNNNINTSSISSLHYSTNNVIGVIGYNVTCDLWYIEQNYTPEELHPIYGNFPIFKFYGSTTTTSDDYD